MGFVGEFFCYMIDALCDDEKEYQKKYGNKKPENKSKKKPESYGNKIEQSFVDEFLTRDYLDEVEEEEEKRRQEEELEIKKKLDREERYEQREYVTHLESYDEEKSDYYDRLFETGRYDPEN